MSSETTQPNRQEKVAPAFFADLPEEARNNLSDEWQVSAELPATRQIGRAINHVEDALTGIVAEGVDKQRAKAEAGRVLSHIRQELEDEDFISDMDPGLRTYLKSEADRLWDDGGQEAYESWKALLAQPQDPAIKGEPAGNESERMLNRFAELTGNLEKIYDVAIKSLDGAIDFFKANFPDETHRIQSLELCKKILVTRISPEQISAQLSQSLTIARERLNQQFDSQSQKAENDKIVLSEVRGKYAKLLQSSFVNVLNALKSGIDAENNPQIKTVFESVHKDIEGILATTGGVHRIVAEPEMEVDFETMEPRDVVETQNSKYRGKDIVANVEENGYVFDQDLQMYNGQGRDIVNTAKVEVYKYQQ